METAKKLAVKKSLPRAGPLLEHMKTVPDSRCGRKTKQVLAEVLVCLVIGYLAGRTSIRRSLNWCRNHFDELRKGMVLEKGIALPATACRMLSGIDGWMFLCVFMEWAGEIMSPKGRHMAIDGKALRGSVEKNEGEQGCYDVECCRFSLARHIC